MKQSKSKITSPDIEGQVAINTTPIIKLDPDIPNNTAEDISQSPTSDDNMPFIQLLMHLSEVSQDVIFAEHGYKRISKITDTMQGELYKAERWKNGDLIQYVAIKKCDKILYQKQEVIQHGMNFIVSENIIKEATILKYLTFHNAPIGGYIVKFIDFFQSDTDYYLVMEYIESEMNLNRFVQTAFKYIDSNRLKLSYYHKVLKYLYWQLVVTIRWMHHDMNCCHLDLCPENIMVTNCNFIEQSDSTFIVNPDISIKICDFGVAEIFKNGNFKCYKQGLSLDNESQLAPKILKENNTEYDARKADIWSLGIILFECMTGQKLYQSHEIWNELSYKKSGYWALQNHKFSEYLTMNNMSRYFKPDCISLLTRLLDMDEGKRYSADDIIRHKWLNAYFDRYHRQISRKSQLQRKELLIQQQNGTMLALPYYISP